ncbi:hypothetical protein NCCP2222_01760 [Sporosarcina sp. NCCP-2222]|uniref:hypothetical protein n=1 Tax=Sporosarcina sp. NCCP-2222 TaxID=2935073 RepID=UPI00208CC914|nr:hypothetical protein [Sporosarcina sp. NCCP-2222]GKV54229.1 hypothetical protein NCCP2222_01760 [Sporosarcina sp. NCCP-2222]
MTLSLLEEETLKFWDRLIVGAKVTIDGVERDFPIHESSYIEGNQLKKFVYLDTDKGNVTKARLIDMHGRSIQEKNMAINKGEHGIMITFFLAIEIKEGVVGG